MAHLCPAQQLAVPQVLLVFAAVLLVMKQGRAHLIPGSLGVGSHYTLTCCSLWHHKQYLGLWCSLLTGMLQVVGHARARLSALHVQ